MDPISEAQHPSDYCYHAGRARAKSTRYWSDDRQDAEYMAKRCAKDVEDPDAFLEGFWAAWNEAEGD